MSTEKTEEEEGRDCVRGGEEEEDGGRGAEEVAAEGGREEGEGFPGSVESSFIFTPIDFVFFRIPRMNFAIPKGEMTHMFGEDRNDS